MPPVFQCSVCISELSAQKHYTAHPATHLRSQPVSQAARSTSSVLLLTHCHSFYTYLLPSAQASSASGASSCEQQEMRVCVLLHLV